MKSIPEKMFVYSIRSGDFVLYIGVTRDPVVRFVRHKTGSSKTSTILRRYRDLRMVVECECTYEEAFEVERQFIEKYSSRWLLNKNKTTRQKRSGKYISHIDPRREENFAAAIARSKVGFLLGY